MITQYLQQILGYHVEFKVCLVSKLLAREVLSNFCKLSKKIDWQIVSKNVSYNNYLITFSHNIKNGKMFGSRS